MELKLADDGAVGESDGGNTSHKEMIAGMLLFVLVIGCICEQLWNEFSKLRIGGIQMVELEGVPNEDGSDISILEQEEKQLVCGSSN